MKRKIIFILFLSFLIKIKAQNPLFINEKPVTINGLTFDAMEPHLSTDGNALFFNSLNDGITTSLYYAARVNDTTFNFIGLVPVVNQTITPRLDGVASIDTASNFYWVSTRNYPSVFENLQRIKFLTNSYTNFGKVYGNFYIYSPGWLIMDAAVNYHGDKLLYCNAWFNSCFGGAPCKSSIGIAQKLNDSTFNKIPNSNAWFSSINDTTNYIVYAPFLTKDELELYYTRLLKNGTQTEIMVASRSTTNSAFGTPSVLITSPSILPEGPALTSDKLKLYYHKKTNSTYKLFVRYRSVTTLIDKIAIDPKITLYPNPANAVIKISTTAIFPVSEKIQIYNYTGTLILESDFDVETHAINVSDLTQGIYFIKFKKLNSSAVKFVKD